MNIKIIILTALCFFSCSDFEKEKSSVDDLIDRVESIEKGFLKIKIDTISSLKMSTYEVERQIKQNYTVDSIDLVLGKKMNDYKRMRKMLGPLGKEEARLKGGLFEVKEQLMKLRTDISKGNGRREMYFEYIEFETSKVNQIKTLYDEYIKTRRDFLDIYNRLNAELIALSLSLRSK